MVPFVTGPSYHDHHHSHNAGNFAGSCYLWDLMLDTNVPYMNDFLKNWWHKLSSCMINLLLSVITSCSPRFFRVRLFLQGFLIVRVNAVPLFLVLANQSIRHWNGWMSWKCCSYLLCYRGCDQYHGWHSSPFSSISPREKHPLASPVRCSWRIWSDRASIFYTRSASPALIPINHAIPCTAHRPPISGDLPVNLPAVSAELWVARSHFSTRVSTRLSSLL